VHQGELGSTCESCHSSRTFHLTSFRHRRQRTFFDGQHAPLRCVQCHPPTSTAGPARRSQPAIRIGFSSTPDACASCHRDVHLGQVGRGCESCHAVETPKFAIAAFAHGTTRFPLTGKHVPLACERCHKVETGLFPGGHGTARRLAGIGTACATCHDDAHRGQFAQDCQSCHTTGAFTIGRYTHLNGRARRSFFAGRHLTATCASCHKPPSIAPATKRAAQPSAIAYVIPTTCTTCHADVHRGALGPRCESCHRP
jgi:hypothetical protein